MLGIPDGKKLFPCYPNTKYSMQLRPCCGHGVFVEILMKADYRGWRDFFLEGKNHDNPD